MNAPFWNEGDRWHVALSQEEALGIAQGLPPAPISSKGNEVTAGCAYLFIHRIVLRASTMTLKNADNLERHAVRGELDSLGTRWILHNSIMSAAGLLDLLHDLLPPKQADHEPPV